MAHNWEHNWEGEYDGGWECLPEYVDESTRWWRGDPDPEHGDDDEDRESENDCSEAIAKFWEIVGDVMTVERLD